MRPPATAPPTALRRLLSEVAEEAADDDGAGVDVVATMVMDGLWVAVTANPPNSPPRTLVEVVADVESDWACEGENIVFSRCEVNGTQRPTRRLGNVPNHSEQEQFKPHCGKSRATSRHAGTEVPNYWQRLLKALIAS